MGSPETPPGLRKPSTENKTNENKVNFKHAHAMMNGFRGNAPQPNTTDLNVDIIDMFNTNALHYNRWQNKQAFEEQPTRPWIRMATNKHDLLKRAVATRAALEPTDQKPPHQLTSAQCRVKTQAPPGIDCEDDKSVLCK